MQGGQAGRRWRPRGGAQPGVRRQHAAGAWRRFQQRPGVVEVLARQPGAAGRPGAPGQGPPRRAPAGTGGTPAQPLMPAFWASPWAIRCVALHCSTPAHCLHRWEVKRVLHSMQPVLPAVELAAAEMAFDAAAFATHADSLAQWRWKRSSCGDCAYATCPTQASREDVPPSVVRSLAQQQGACGKIHIGHRPQQCLCWASPREARVQHSRKTELCQQLASHHCCWLCRGPTPQLAAQHQVYHAPFGPSIANTLPVFLGAENIGVFAHHVHLG